MRGRQHGRQTAIITATATARQRAIKGRVRRPRRPREALLLAGYLAAVAQEPVNLSNFTANS